MKNVQNYSIKILFLLALICVLDHDLQAGGIFSSQIAVGETVKNYDEVFDQAQALDRNNRSEEALKLYNEIIAAPESISTKLRLKAHLHRAKFYYAQAWEAHAWRNYDPHQNAAEGAWTEWHLHSAQDILRKIIHVPSFDQVNTNDWAQACLIDAQIYLSTAGPHFDELRQVDIGSAYRAHAAEIYSMILQEENINIDPALMFQAAYRLGKLCYNFPRDVLRHELNNVSSTE